jgi:AraC family transcriptional activator of tynA and feaB
MPFEDVSNGRGKVVAVGGEFWCLDEVAGSDRPDRWEGLLSQTHLPWTVKVTKQRSDGDYEAWVRRQWIDDLALVDCECGPCAGSRGRAELSGTDGEYVAVLITRSGSETVAQEGAEAYMRPGDAVAWDSTRPARFEVWEPLAKRSLLIPRSALDEVSGRAWTSAGVLLDGKAPAVRLLIGYLDALSRTLPDLSMSGVSAARNATLELFIGALQPGGSVDSSTVGPALRANMERWIERHLLDGEVTSAAIAAAHNVSVRTVYRVFEMTDETVGEVVRVRRLAKARRDLMEGGEPISAIAYRWRFSDSSHFSKAFKAHYGVSPSEYRALYQARGDRQEALALR